MNWHSIPVYITNRNNLDRGFRRLILWLREAGMHKVVVLDNESAWQPLHHFYDTSGLHVIHLDQNLGPQAFWELGLHHAQDTPFIVTDSDVVPAGMCPFDLVGRMLSVQEKYSHVAKVGPSLRTDNLPDYYGHKQEVLKWEVQFWKDPIRNGGWPECYHAGIDTTFALYQPRAEHGGSSHDPKAQHLRLAPPYVAEHVPWYNDTSHPSPELQHYRAHTNPKWSNW